MWQNAMPLPDQLLQVLRLHRGHAHIGKANRNAQLQQGMPTADEQQGLPLVAEDELADSVTDPILRACPESAWGGRPNPRPAQSGDCVRHEGLVTQGLRDPVQALQQTVLD